ncbi:MAG TPA: hypothetical protein V6D50_03580 [Chroococcales cyanobacterium]
MSAICSRLSSTKAIALSGQRFRDRKQQTLVDPDEMRTTKFPTNGLARLAPFSQSAIAYT